MRAFAAARTLPCRRPPARVVLGSGRNRRFAPVERIGVRDLRNSVAAVLRRAAGGERIVVTVDGVPTAQLGPLEPAATTTIDDLVATGLVAPPRRARPRGLGDDDLVVTGVARGVAVPIDAPVDVRVDDVLDEIRGR